MQKSKATADAFCSTLSGYYRIALLGLALVAGQFVLISGITPVFSAEVKAESGGNLVVETRDARHAFRVELAATPASRSRGLMHRKEMADQNGMLFDFGSEQPVSMWMKNTWISLDMLFIDSTGKILQIAQETTPHSLEHIRSIFPVRAVLEINGGMSQTLGIKPGDHIRHPLFGAGYRSR